MESGALTITIYYNSCNTRIIGLYGFQSILHVYSVVVSHYNNTIAFENNIKQRNQIIVFMSTYKHTRAVESTAPSHLTLYTHLLYISYHKYKQTVFNIKSI